MWARAPRGAPQGEQETFPCTKRYTSVSALGDEVISAGRPAASCGKCFARTSSLERGSAPRLCLRACTLRAIFVSLATSLRHKIAPACGAV